MIKRKINARAVKLPAKQSRKPQTQLTTAEKSQTLQALASLDRQTAAKQCGSGFPVRSESE